VEGAYEREDCCYSTTTGPLVSAKCNDKGRPWLVGMSKLDILHRSSMPK
jgi:hypothetical protein